MELEVSTKKENNKISGKDQSLEMDRQLFNCFEKAMTNFSYDLFFNLFIKINFFTD